MTPVVSFKSQQGAVFIPGHSDELGIYSVNVAEADLNIYRVKPDQLVSFLQEYKRIASSGAYHYRNANRAKWLNTFTPRVLKRQAKQISVK